MKGAKKFFYSILPIACIAILALACIKARISHNDIFSAMRNIAVYRTNAIKQASEEQDADSYNRANSELKIQLAKLKKIGSLSNEDKNNFIGYIGKYVKDFGLATDRIEFINVDNLGKDPKCGIEEQLLKLNKQSLQDSMKANQDNNNSESTKNKADQESNKTATSIEQINKNLPVEKQGTLNGIDIVVSGDGNSLNSFICNIERYFFKYYYVNVTNTSDKSKIRLIIDLR